MPSVVVVYLGGGKPLRLVHEVPVVKTGVLKPFKIVDRHIAHSISLRTPSKNIMLRPLELLSTSS